MRKQIVVDALCPECKSGDVLVYLASRDHKCRDCQNVWKLTVKKEKPPTFENLERLFKL